MNAKSTTDFTAKTQINVEPENTALSFTNLFMKNVYL